MKRRKRRMSRAMRAPLEIAGIGMATNIGVGLIEKTGGTSAAAASARAQLAGGASMLGLAGPIIGAGAVINTMKGLGGAEQRRKRKRR